MVKENFYPSFNTATDLEFLREKQLGFFIARKNNLLSYSEKLKWIFCYTKKKTTLSITSI